MSIVLASFKVGNILRLAAGKDTEKPTFPSRTSKGGYMVSFERREGSGNHLLASDHFPERSKEKLFADEEQAWEYARYFAEATVGKVVNVYVINSDYVPIDCGKRMGDRRIYNRYVPGNTI